MKMFPVKYELYQDNDEDCICTLKAFDDESYEINIHNSVITSDELRDIADCLEFAEKSLKKGTFIKQEKCNEKEKNKN